MLFRVLGTLYLVVSSYVVHAQCVDLEPEDSIYGYRERDGRCEGFYKANVSGFAIEVVSLTQGNISYASNSNEKLKISSMSLNDFSSISVQGVNISMNKNYRLDLKLEKGEVAVIPVKDVLEPNKVKPENLGLFGFVERSGFKYLVPVMLSSELSQPTSDKKRLRLALTSNIDLKTFTWRYATTQDDLCGEYSELITLPAPIFEKNSPIELEIPTAILNEEQETSLCIQVSVLGTNGMEFNENIRLMIPRTVI